MRRGRLTAGGLAAAIVAAALLLGGVLRGSPAAAPARASAEALGSGFASEDTATLVAQLQDSLRRAPRNVQGLDLLGLAYQQRARETGDPAYYTTSAGALRLA